MTASLDAAIEAFSPRLPLAVAYSGGADSTGLLAACAHRWPGQVIAVHINHGLQAAASDFEKHCDAACQALGVPLHIERADAANAPGESPEDAARRARYESIHRVAVREGAAGVALAQHADDQVETILLALTRGAGLAGLAGMRARWDRDGIEYSRPLLTVAGADIRAWLQSRGVRWIEDPSNASEDFTRNRIRARILLPLREAFPASLDTFARSARHAAQAQALLDEFARDDLALTGAPPAIEVLRTLSVPRRANVLRHWLLVSHGATPSDAQLGELLTQIANCSTRGHRIHLKAGSGMVTREGPLLQFSNP
jgi:tRNA(Ile)-lysidine synthase